jgi:hypothetical protein
MLVPVGKNVIDGKESRNTGTRGVCICISSVTGEDEVVEGGSKSTEEAEDGSLNARGVRFGEFMENGSSTGRAITTVTRTAFATSFDLVLPVGSQDNSIKGALTRFSKHTKILKLVTLFSFSLVPEGPGGKGLELTSSKIAES